MKSSIFDRLNLKGVEEAGSYNLFLVFLITLLTILAPKGVGSNETI